MSQKKRTVKKATKRVSRKKTVKKAEKKKSKKLLLKITNLDAGYDKLHVLKKVDMSLNEGELCVIIGPNGSGKSTAIKSVFHITNIMSGGIWFDGKVINTMSTHQIVKLGIGYVPQGRLVFDTLTVEENLEMGAFGMSAADIKPAKEHVMNMFPILRERLHQRASFLSGGQQQMLSISRALMRKPKLLLLDEPSLGLDPITQQFIFATIKEICKTGTTIMMVEQNARQALKICTKAYVIENGQVVAVGGPDLAKRKQIQELYLGGA